ncbi:MAG: AAA family ATPase [Acidimicrobiales bacterium]
MEPVDYLKIIQRHWKMAAALVVVTLVAVFLMSPKQPAKVYEAQHTLLRDQASGDGDGTSSADNPSVVSLWAERGEVPKRAAEVLGFDGPVDDLIAEILATPNPELGTVEIVASASTPAEAVLRVNTFADELLAFIQERDQARVDQARKEGSAQVTQLREQIDELDRQIAAAGGPAAPAAETLVFERDGLASQIALVNSDTNNIRSSTEWTSLQRAGSAKAENESVVGATRGQRMVLAALVSVLLAFGVAIMLDRSDSRLHTKEQAERQFGLPVLAEVPLLPMRTRHRAAVQGFENAPGVAEAYRGLRTALLLFRDHLPLELEAAELSGQGRSRQSGSGSRQVIVVTSPEAGDGKSTTAANLAMAYAEAGQSVLLVCWDLWRPMGVRVLDVEDGPGVSEFLAAGNASLVRFVQTTSVPGLHVVPAGELGHQPGGQLDAGLRLLEEARSLADVVIIDTAPILAASVTRELVTMADVVILACRAGRTTSPNAERCAELLERLGAPTLGVVLVGVPTSLFKSDYYSKSPSRVDRLRQPLARTSPADRYVESPSNGGNVRTEPSFLTSPASPSDPPDPPSHRIGP